MRHKFSRSLVLIPLALGLCSCQGQLPAPTETDPLVVGVKIYQRDGELSSLFEQWIDLGFNTLFVSEQLARSHEFRELARTHGMPVFVILPIFYNPEVLQEQPELYALTSTGEHAVEDWVEFVCPSRREYRQQRVLEIERLVTELEPDGISIDFIRHFAFWEMIGPQRTASSLPNTCFCASCMAAFSKAAGVNLPREAESVEQRANWVLENHLDIWAGWKCRLITSMVEEIVTAAAAARPGLRVNLHAVPWRKGDYDGAIKKVIGQDLVVISRYTDYLSPMCYSFMLSREPAWISSVVQELAADTSCPILPSIQVKEYYRPDERFDEQQFEACLSAALAPPSAGVVLWSWDAIAQEPEKQRIIKRLCGGRPIRRPV
jgi:hypothetical protein